MEDKFNYPEYRLTYRVVNSPGQVTDFFKLTFDQVKKFQHLYSKVEVLTAEERTSPLELMRMKKSPEAVELQDLQEFQMDLAFEHFKKKHSPSLAEMRVAKIPMVEISFVLDCVDSTLLLR
jgi:hypothetical protein